MSIEVLVFLVVLALAFDFMNGFHDAANSIATIVSTRVLSPKYAVLWAATFNFIALWIFKLSVAKTIPSGTAMFTTMVIATPLQLLGFG